MKRDPNASIIPKLILFMGGISLLGVFWLFFRPHSRTPVKGVMPATTEELFSQVIQAAEPEILKLWEEGESFTSLSCDAEIRSTPQVGRSYYRCQPHFWQCFWEGGVRKNPQIKIDIFGQTYHLVARPVFSPIKAYSDKARFYQAFKNKSSGLNIKYGYSVELSVKEIPGFSQPLVLTDTCRDTYLPERIYGYGKKNFEWDNFGRRIFIDKYYVSRAQINEWRVLTNQLFNIEKDRDLWPTPAILSLDEQKSYCSFYGKRLLEAKLFDAATMPPEDQNNPRPEKVLRPQTPWHRDHAKTFLGMARINDDFQLTPLDCQLAQVQGCKYGVYTTDSATWMGINFPIGFYSESLENRIEPSLNLKLSSRQLPPDSEWHELALRSTWKGIQEKQNPVAFRCYEEVVP